MGRSPQAALPVGGVVHGRGKGNVCSPLQAGHQQQVVMLRGEGGQYGLAWAWSMKHRNVAGSDPANMGKDDGGC